MSERPWLRKKRRIVLRPGERKTHCINGHEFTKENTFRDSRGARNCYKCANDRRRRYRKRKAVQAWKESAS